MRLYHGGVPGLRPGDTLTGGHARPAHAGCAMCAANAAGQHHPLSPLTAHQNQVYMTPHRLYAAHYASLWGRGDLYQVEPLGPLVRSDEDSIETWTAPTARIVVAVDRAVLLTWSQRRRLWRQWSAADAEMAMHRARARGTDGGDS